MTQQERSSRLAIARTALALALIVIGIAAAKGWFVAWHALEEHGYLEQGFKRGAFVTLRDVSRTFLGDGVKWGAVLGLAFVVLAVLVARLGVNGRPAGFVAAVASPSIVAWATVGVALLAIASLIELGSERDWIGGRDIGFVIGFAILCAIVLSTISRRARGQLSTANSATIVGLLGAFAFFAPAAFWIGHGLPYHPTDKFLWAHEALAVVFAALLFVWIRSRARASLEGRRVSWLTGPLAVFAIISALVALAPFAVPAFASTPPLVAKQPFNVVVIGIDTLRYDELSLTGANLRGRDTTPNLRKLAERGVVFEHAQSQAPWTLPSFASILTGVYPHEHGAYSLVGHLRNRENTLAEVLREAGYRTLGITSQVYLENGSGFEQGCDVFDDTAIRSEHESNGDHTSDAAIRALRGVDTSKPFFAFVHYFDPHSDYIGHDGWTWADGYKGWLQEQIAFDNLERNRDKLDAADLQYINDLYDEETAFTDQQIGRVLDELDKLGLSERTLIVVCVDHGDQFLDHGNFGHTTTMYDELIRVPLIVVPPASKQGSRRADVVETRNIFGTVLDVLGVDDARWSTARAHSLLHAAKDDSRAFSIVWLPDSKPSSGKHMCASAMREGRWKCVHDWTREKRMLFDLDADPRELDNRFEHEKELAERMSRELDAWTLAQRQRGGDSSVRDLDQQTLDSLRRLGYLGDDKK